MNNDIVMMSRAG